jgi:hypothetical protein
MCYEQGRHTRLVHSNAHSVASYTRLRHFKYRATNATSITNTDFLVEKSVNGEILSELSEGEIATAKQAFPVAVGVHLVDEYGAVFSAMTSQVCLRIAINETAKLRSIRALFVGLSLLFVVLGVIR